MRRFLVLAVLPVSLLSSAVLIGTGSGHAQTGGGAGAALARTHCPSHGVSLLRAYAPPNPQVVPAYFSNDYRLGPADLPRTGRLGKMLAGYKRFSGHSPDAFFGCFWQTAPYANWHYPVADGFVTRDGKPVEQTVTLRPGQKIDMFGNPGNTDEDYSQNGGQFVSPAGTPYKERAIPPTNLDTYSKYYPFNYHIYTVLKPFSVQAGRIAPWFDQPGGGTQDYLGDTTGDDLPSNPGIANLVRHGYVQALPAGSSS